MKLLMVVSFAGMFNLYVVLTVLPLYVVELGGTAFHAGLLAGVGLWTAVALRLVFGPMTDERGRRLPLIIGTAAFALAPLGFWLAPFCVRVDRHSCAASDWSGGVFGRGQRLGGRFQPA